jgi:hypothetical protein
MHTVPIMAGMWGLKTKDDRALAFNIFQMAIDRSLALKYNRDLSNYKGGDQAFLGQKVRRLVFSRSVMHDSFWCRANDYATPWPTRREGNCFVGSPSECDPNATSFNHICPVECRPKEHLDWTYC